MRNFDSILFDRLVDKELEPYHITHKQLQPEDDDWFLRYTMTKEQESEFIEWAVKEVQGYMKCSKKVAQEDVSWFILGCGLRVVNP